MGVLQGGPDTRGRGLPPLRVLWVLKMLAGGRVPQPHITIMRTLQDTRKPDAGTRHGAFCPG